MTTAGLTSTSESLSAVFLPDAILLGLDVRTKREAIERMVRHLKTLRGLGDDDERTLVQAILAREQTGTTGIGNGVAFPHCRSTTVVRPTGILALDPHGIPFDALDKQLVYCVFLLVSPQGSAKSYELLGKIAAVGKDKSQCLRLLGCRTRDALHQFLCDLDRS